MTDLLKAPAIGPFLRWRHSRTALQIPLLILSVGMVVHGLFGPQLAPKNLATSLTWVYFRGALVLVLLFAGNFFCMACPFMLAQRLARRVFHPFLNWPRALRNKWLSIALLISVLFIYELFDLWSSPRLTAWLIVLYFVAAVSTDVIFKHATFCKFVCPIGQFNFIASLISPLEVKVRSHVVCDGCSTKDCIKGRQNGLVAIQSGCQLALFQPLKVGNMDCTFCLECVQACPHDNVGILPRTPADELTLDPPRSGIGRLSRRKDIQALAVVFTFAALLNAFGMVSPVYAVEHWIGSLLHIGSEGPVLAIVFVAFLVPALLSARYGYGLIPLGFGMWLAHYGFHLLTGLYTIVPLTLSLFGPANWRLTGIPARYVLPIEIGFLTLGLAGSLALFRHMAARTAYVTLCLVLFGFSLWLLFQPMEMRGMSQ